MQNDRRNFLKKTGIAGLSMAGASVLSATAQTPGNAPKVNAGEATQSTPDALPEPGPMDNILLKDWRPRSSIVVRETLVKKAMYPVIDSHSHDYSTDAANIVERVRTMDETGVESTVVLTGAIGERFDRMAELYLKTYSDRFQLYCGFDRTDIHAQDYPQRVAVELERCYKMGARGVGELSDKGQGFARGTIPPMGTHNKVSQKAGEPYQDRLHADDPRLDAFWEKCAELKLPANIHIADHPSCWTPADANQERTAAFQRYIQHPNITTSYEELMAIRDRTCQRHPNTTFIFCHLSNQGNDLEALGKSLDKYPNLVLDMSARHYEMNRTPRAAVKFLEKYPDRVMFGTDLPGVRLNSMYENYWRLMETDDEYIKGPSWWMLYGLNLPPSLLEPLYHGNAKRILNWEKV